MKKVFGIRSCAYLLCFPAVVLTIPLIFCLINSIREAVGKVLLLILGLTLFMFIGQFSSFKKITLDDRHFNSVIILNPFALKINLAYNDIISVFFERNYSTPHSIYITTRDKKYRIDVYLTGREYEKLYAAMKAVIKDIDQKGPY